MIENVPLDRIEMNPFQTRTTEDQEHLQNLAHSIAEQGLLQIPTGRRDPHSADYVQLAFGHSRFAAFCWLAEAGHADNNDDYREMPVNILELNDEQMFEMAVAENHDRKNLNPLEEARAMAVYRDQFGKTSEEIGELFHLSDSAVRNKIRLLGLPEEAQESLSKGQMTEGAARAMLPFLALPVEVRKQWENAVASWERPAGSFTKQAFAGEISAAEIASQLARMEERGSRDLAGAWWKFDDVLESNDVQSLTCRPCPLRKNQRCLDSACFSEKERIYKANYLYRASRAIGIKEIEADRVIYHTDFVTRYWEGQKQDNDKTQAIIKGGCENLRVAFDDTHREPVKNASHCVTGFPRAMIVCKNFNGQCRCMAGYDAVQKQPEKPEELTSDQLRQAAADRLKQKRIDNERIIKLEELAGDLLGMAAANYDERALITLVARSGMFSTSPDFTKRWQQVAKEKARAMFNANLDYTSFQGWINEANKILESCGLPALTPDDAGAKAEEILARQPAEMVWKL